MTGISKSQVSRLCAEIDDKDRGLPQSAARRRLARSVARCHRRQRPQRRARALDRGDPRDCRQQRRPGAFSPRAGPVGRGAGDGHRPVRGRNLLDRVPAQARSPRFARRQAAHLGRARRLAGSRRQGPARLLAALPGALHAQPLGACRQAGPASRAGKQGRQAGPASRAGASSPPSSILPSPRRTPRPPAPSAQWRQVADQLRPKVPKLAGLMDEAEADVLAFISFPKSLPSRRRGTTGPRSTRPTLWNGSTARSSAAPRWSASSQTKQPSPA
jgi:hypothetical protein